MTVHHMSVLLAHIIIMPLASGQSYKPVDLNGEITYYLSADAAGSVDPNVRRAAAKRECKLLASAMERAWKSRSSHCGLASDTRGIENARRSGAFEYHASAIRLANGALQVTIQDWNGNLDETDPLQSGWTIEPASAASQGATLEKLLRGAYGSFNSRRFQKEALLKLSLDTLPGGSEKIRFDPKDGEYKEKISGKTLSFEDAWRLYANEKPNNRQYLKAAIEIFAFSGTQVGVYWADKKTNARDWELGWDWPSWRKKLSGEAVRFDNNYHATNSVGHPMAGAYYYLFMRSGNFTTLESFLAAFAASAFWEFICEFREKVSLNDLIVTPLAGMAIGEVLAQLGAFFDKGENSIVNNVLASVFGTPRKLYEWISKNKPKRSANTGRWGFTTDIWHEFALYAGTGYSHASGTSKGPGGTQHHSHAGQSVSIGFETEIINIPIYGKPGKAARLLWDGNFTQSSLKAVIDAEGLLEFQFFAKAALFGYYKQNTSEDARGSLSGYSFFIGAASAYDYSVHRKGEGAHTAVRDKLGIVNVLGPTLNLSLYYKGLSVRMVIDVFGDFAIVRSYAIDRWSEHNSTEGIRSVLAEQKYYYAFGITITPKLVASYKDFEAGAEFKFDYFRSIDFKDRHQEDITNHFSLTDHRTSWRAWLAYTFPGDFLKFVLSVEQCYREGFIQDISEKHVETTVMGNLVFVF